MALSKGMHRFAVGDRFISDSGHKGTVVRVDLVQAGDIVNIVPVYVVRWDSEPERTYSGFGWRPLREGERDAK